MLQLSSDYADEFILIDNPEHTNQAEKYLKR